ncbi:hypothetical protein L1887_36886 [Cichorium endivia]|nr:hypothetical protein L1887_36886 [Cichorium endivia]
MDAAQWAKDVMSNGGYTNTNQVEEKKVKPQHEQALNCPRCNSTNTKFCYYNNYSLTQPRYFCKACKRYWTKGGSLRSVPVGGGSRKNKRSSMSSSMPKPIDLSHLSCQNFTTHEQDYNLGFSQFLKLPKIENSNANFLSSGGLNSFSTTTTGSDSMLNGTRFSLQDFKPTLGFPFQGNVNFQEDNERIFGVLNQQHSSRETGQSMGQGNSNGYWNESLGGGSSTLYN